MTLSDVSKMPRRYTSRDAVFGLAPDPGAKRLDSDAECRENFGEELNSHFNYERDSLERHYFWTITTTRACY